jgi:hypothetical protein
MKKCITNVVFQNQDPKYNKLMNSKRFEKLWKYFCFRFYLFLKKYSLYSDLSGGPQVN